MNASARKIAKRRTIRDRAGESLDQPESGRSDCSNLKYDNDFWRFSLAVYRQDRVAEECLALQESIGLDVNLLLFCAWTGSQSTVLSSANIQGASSSVAAWQDRVVRPLRSARQYMKLLEGGEIEDLRARVKGVEIEAEQVEQAILFAYSKDIQGNRPGTDPLSAIVQNVKKYIEIRSGVEQARSSELSAPLLVEAAFRLRAYATAAPRLPCCPWPCPSGG